LDRFDQFEEKNKGKVKELSCAARCIEMGNSQSNTDEKSSTEGSKLTESPENSNRSQTLETLALYDDRVVSLLAELIYHQPNVEIVKDQEL